MPFCAGSTRILFMAIIKEMLMSLKITRKELTKCFLIALNGYSRQKPESRNSESENHINFCFKAQMAPLPIA
jgi:hypothetical protein